MRQSSTGLAPRATGRTTASRAPDPAMATPAPAREPVAALHGVMTGLANLVNEHLGRLTIGPQATRFLRHLERLTFGNAGWHRRAGRSDPGLWCPYDHAAWADALGLSSSALAHLRTCLIEAGIVWYTPDPQRRGHGALGWSFDFASWTPCQWGGTRSGAGRLPAPVRVTHRAAATVAIPDEFSLVLPSTEEDPPRAKVLGQAHQPAASGGAGPAAASDAEPAIQDVNE